VEDRSERNIPTDSQHVKRTQSIGDLNDLSSKGKEKAMSQDQTEDVARKDTPTSTQTQSIEELLELLRELREKNVHGNLHSSPQYVADSFAQPHTNPTPHAPRSSDGTLPLLRPEYKIPPAYVTKVYHHYHYHYNAPNVSPPSIINKNIVRINNNTSNGCDSRESGDDEGEH
jgi:hypothetical protein